MGHDDIDEEDELLRMQANTPEKTWAVAGGAIGFVLGVCVALFRYYLVYADWQRAGLLMTPSLPLISMGAACVVATIAGIWLGRGLARWRQSTKSGKVLKNVLDRERAD